MQQYQCLELFGGTLGAFALIHTFKRENSLYDTTCKYDSLYDT
jgi:hypothetical protein